jgi:hypothetical protein
VLLMMLVMITVMTGFSFRPVSKAVNSVKNNSAELIEAGK